VVIQRGGFVVYGYLLTLRAVRAKNTRIDLAITNSATKLRTSIAIFIRAMISRISMTRDCGNSS
jgi:hypothetical protein